MLNVLFTVLIVSSKIIDMPGAFLTGTRKMQIPDPFIPNYFSPFLSVIMA